MKLILVGINNVENTDIIEEFAENIDVEYLDLNEIIEEDIGEIDEYIDRHGDDRFNEIASQTLEFVLEDDDDFILSCDENILDYVKNIGLIEKEPFIIHLRGPESDKTISQYEYTIKPDTSPEELSGFIVKVLDSHSTIHKD